MSMDHQAVHDVIVRIEASLANFEAANQKPSVDILHAMSDIPSALVHIAKELRDSGHLTSTTPEQRLFAAVARIEGTVAKIEQCNGNFAKDTIVDIPTLVREAAAVAEGLEKTGGGGSHTAVVSSFGVDHVGQRLTANACTTAESEERTAVLEAFDVLSAGKINEYFDLSRELGEPVAGQAELVRQAYVALRRLIKIAPHTREPGPKILKELLVAIEEAILAVGKFGVMKNTDETLYHMMGVGEGIKALAWVSVGLQWRTDKKKTPVEWVQRCIELAEEDYFGGIYDGRADNDLNVRWAKSFIATITELLEYVKTWHPENLAWGNKMRSMTFWSNALAQTAPGDGNADEYEFHSGLGIPIAKRKA
eukprot:m.409381 g.409381  ORF g.409381 m.409381 type:complete len:365 (+) comp21244_c1_seq19:253-1347(+)